MIPKFKYFTKQILETLVNSETLYKRDIIKEICKGFNLSIEDKRAVTKGGNSIVIDRVSWACAYLVRAKAIERVSKGCYKITEIGIQILKDKNEVVDNYTLAKYNSNFSDFQYIPKRGVNDKRYKNNKLL